MELEYSINELNDMNKSSNNELINELNSIFKILKQIPLELTKIYQLLSDAASQRETIIQGPYSI